MAVESNVNSCLMTGKWDMAINSATGKHTEGRQIYLLNAIRMANASNIEANYGFSVIERKNKIRGSGKSLVLRFESETGKDFELLGWALDVTGVTQ